MKILQICNKPPFPPVEGGSIAMHNLCEGLTKNGHEVTILAMNTFKQFCKIEEVPQKFIKLTNYTLVYVNIHFNLFDAFINLFTRESLNITRFKSEDFSNVLIAILKHQTFDLVLLESIYTAPYIDSIKSFHKGHVILRSHNVEFEIWNNLSANESNPLKKWYLKLLAKRLKKYEMQVLSKVDGIAAISASDMDTYKKLGCATKMTYVPFGVDFDNVQYSKPSKPEFCLFHVGSMSWLPHRQAFKWFFIMVWPKVIECFPEIKLYLAGSGMPDWITAGKIKNLIVIPDYVDGKKFMNDKIIMIVPSISGSGIRIKIIEGLSRGKVIITSANGAKGINYAHGMNMFVSDNPAEWINIIHTCITNWDEVERVSENARKLAFSEYNYTEAAKKLIAFYNALALVS